jgi:hypothetical protein
LLAGEEDAAAQAGLGRRDLTDDDAHEWHHDQPAAEARDQHGYGELPRVHVRPQGESGESEYGVPDCLDEPAAQDEAGAIPLLQPWSVDGRDQEPDCHRQQAQTAFQWRHVCLALRRQREDEHEAAKGREERDRQQQPDPHRAEPQHGRRDQWGLSGPLCAVLMHAEHGNGRDGRGKAEPGPERPAEWATLGEWQE